MSDNDKLPILRPSDQIVPSPRALPPARFDFGGVEPDGFDLHRTMAMAIRRRKLILATFLLVVGAAAVYTWSVRPVYAGRARILVNTSGNQSSQQGELPVVADLLAVTRTRSVETQAEIVKSPMVRQRALAQLTSAERSTTVGAGPLDVQAAKSTDIISISALSYDPNVAAKLANAVCSEYMKADQQGSREQTRIAAEYVKTQLSEVRGKLDRAQPALKEYKRNNSTIDLAAESKELVTELSQVESDLRETEAQRASSRAELATYSVGGTRRRGWLDPRSTTVNPTINAIKSDLVKLELDRTSALQEYTANSPEVRQVDRQIQSAREQLAKEAERSVAQDRAPIQARLWSFDARANILSSAGAKLRARLSTLPEREYRLSQLTIELGVLDQTYRMLNEKYQALRISEEARLSTATVIEPADVPSQPMRPRKALNLVLAMVLGIGLALGLATVAERLDSRVHTGEEAEIAAQIPVLGHIPFTAVESARVLTAGASAASPVLEAYRLLRTSVLRSEGEDPIRSVAITSAEPNEGKTLSSVNLAVAVALDGKTVILVDADLRHADVHRHFGLSNEVGFTNVVAGERPVEEALQDTNIPGLRVLASGPLHPSPPELLNSRASRACFQRLSQLADFVVIDTPPALLMADAHIVARMTDGVLLVVSARDSAKHRLDRTSYLLRQTGARLLGTVLNKADEGLGGYYGYHRYPYYRGAGLLVTPEPESDPSEEA